MVAGTQDQGVLLALWQKRGAVMNHRSTYLDDSVPRVEVCAGCGVAAPTACTNYTVISSRYGWRLSHVEGEPSARAVEWRCPTCWAKFRAQGQPWRPAYGQSSAG